MGWAGWFSHRLRGKNLETLRAGGAIVQRV